MFDIIVMIIILIFSFIWIITIRFKYTEYGYYIFALFRVPFYGYFLFVMYLYTMIKSILGIALIINKIFNKNKSINPKKYLLYLLPSVILIVLYLIFIYNIIKVVINSGWYKEIDNILLFISVPISKGFNIWFPSMNSNIILTFVIIIGIIMWLIYWTLYENTIHKIKILLNVITPISVIILYFEILLQFSK